MPVYSDTFAGSGALGVTEVGGLTWEIISGTWSRSSGRASATENGNNNPPPIAVVDIGTGQVDLSVAVSSGGGDAIYFRVTDQNNWLRARVRKWQTSSTYYTTEYYWSASYSGTRCGGVAVNESTGGWSSNGSTCPHSNGYSKYDASCTLTYWMSRNSCSVTDTRQVANTSYSDNYRVYLEKCVDGVITQLGSYSATPTSLRVFADAGNLTVYINGTARITASDATHQNATKHGIGRGTSEYQSSTLDNFSIEPLIPPTPTIVAPAHNSTVNTGTPTLTGTVSAWGSSQTKLEYQIATDAAFTANVKNIAEDSSQFRLSGNSSTPVTEANLLTQTGWYIRARQVSSSGLAGNWSAANYFIVAHSPGATNLRPTNGQGVVVGASNEFSWDFIDSSPTDSQSARRIIIERNDNAALILDTGKEAITADTFNYTIDPTLLNVQLRWRLMVWDEEDKPSAWTNYQLFIPTDAPVVTVLEPADGSNVTTSRPLVRWSFLASGGRSQSYHRVTVEQQGAATPHFDSGQLAGSLDQYLIDVPVIENAKTYIIKVYATDSLGITVMASSTVQAVYEEPDVVAFSADGSYYKDSGYVRLTWQPVSDPSFVKWRVYRRRVGDSAWTMLTEIDEFTVTEYRDWLVPAMDSYDYYVVQVVQRFTEEVESFVGSAQRVVLDTGGYWLIDPNSSSNNLRLENVTAETYTSMHEQAEYTIAGRGRHVDEGETIGASGNLTVQFRDNLTGTARDKKRKLEALRKKKKPLYLRNPFGDLEYVALGDLGVTRVAGTGSMEAVDVTVPYLQVF